MNQLLFRKCLNCANGTAVKIDKDFICLTCKKTLSSATLKAANTEKNFNSTGGFLNQRRLA